MMNYDEAKEMADLRYPLPTRTPIHAAIIFSGITYLILMLFYALSGVRVGAHPVAELVVTLLVAGIAYGLNKSQHNQHSKYLVDLLNKDEEIEQ